MVRLAFDHVLRCAPHRFWTGFFNPLTIASFYTQGIGFTRFDVRRQATTTSSIEREADCHIPVALSRQLQALFKTGFSFVEEGVLDHGEAIWRFRWTPATLPSKIHFHGSMKAEDVPDAPETCRRIAEIEVTAKVPILGRLIERTAEKVLRDTWDRSAVVINEWLEQGIWI